MDGPLASPTPSATVDRPAPELVAAADRLVRERLRFGIPAAAIGLGAYVTIAALTGFTDVLEVPVAGAMSLALLMLMLLVPLAWGLALLYRRRADRWDAAAAAIRESAARSSGPAATS